MKRITKTEAIRHAREHVSALSRLGDGWIYSTFDPEMDGWWQRGPKDWWNARNARSGEMIEIATLFLTDGDENAAIRARRQYEEGVGRWTDYVEVAS